MKNTTRKLLGLLGLANKAGKLALGEKANKNLLKNKDTYLIILASDMQQRNKFLFLKKGEECKIPVKVFSNSSILGLALGFPPVKVIGFKSLSLFILIHPCKFL